MQVKSDESASDFMGALAPKLKALPWKSAAWAWGEARERVWGVLLLASAKSAGYLGWSECLLGPFVPLRLGWRLSACFVHSGPGVVTSLLCGSSAKQKLWCPEDGQASGHFFCCFVMSLWLDLPRGSCCC